MTTAAASLTPLSSNSMTRSSQSISGPVPAAAALQQPMQTPNNVPQPASLVANSQQVNASKIEIYM